jgi:hypothetical protein
VRGAISLKDAAKSSAESVFEFWYVKFLTENSVWSDHQLKLDKWQVFFMSFTQEPPCKKRRPFLGRLIFSDFLNT